MKEQVYIIKGQPLALARPRFGYKKVYDSQKHHKIWCEIELKNQQPKEPISGPIIFNVDFYFEIPPTRRKKVKENYPHFYKPDLSNLVKFIEDVCNDVLFKDDCLIMQINASKKYSLNPRTEFVIRKYEKNS